jgi:hypothetical protein
LEGKPMELTGNRTSDSITYVLVKKTGKLGAGVRGRVVKGGVELYDLFQDSNVREVSEKRYGRSSDLDAAEGALIDRMQGKIDVIKMCGTNAAIIDSTGRFN